jgi:branched-chain amino acid aminotransferase
VYRQPDGSVATFRPEANAARFRASAVRLAMPELPDELFLTALRELVTADEAWVPAPGGEDSLYLRPFLLGTSPGLVVDAATDYVFCLIATPAGAYFSGGLTPIRPWLSTDYVRAVPGGTGAAKCSANYAASLAAQAAAVHQGCDQVVWLDAVERRWVEEMGVMNLFFVFGSGADLEVVTPELDGSLLPGVTRDSLLKLAADLGAQVSERPVAVDEWRTRAADGSLTEVFASGTAAVVTAVGSVRDRGGTFAVGDGRPGPFTTTLRGQLVALQRGQAADPHGWMRPLTVE